MRPKSTDVGRVSRAVTAVALALVLGVSGCGGGDDGEVVEPEIQRPPSGDPSSLTTTTAPPEQVDDAEAAITTEPRRDVGEFDLETTTVRLLCPGQEAAVPLDGETSGPLTAEVAQDISYDLDEDGIPERVVLASCRAVEADGGGGDSQRSVVALTASTDGLVQLGGPLPARALHDVDASLVAERSRTVDGRRVTTHTPLTVIEGRLTEGGTGLPLTVSDPALPMGLGGLEIGASYPLLASNVGRSVTVLDDGSGDECVVVVLEGAVDGVRGLGGDGTLASVEVTNPAIRTDTGLGLGSTEDEVRAAYGEHLERARDPGVPGREFLVATPPDTDGLIAVFEVSDGKVVNYRVGEPGWASALDGCG